VSDQLAIEAAREIARKRMIDSRGQMRHSAFIAFTEGFMAGAAWQSAQSAKFLEGVVRARDRQEGD